MAVPKPTPEMMASLPPEVVALIQSLLARIEELEKRLNKNAGMNPGGQPGNPRQTLELIPLENSVPNLGHFPMQSKKSSSTLPGVDQDRKQFQVDAWPMVRPIVIERRLDRLACACVCHHHCRARRRRDFQGMIDRNNQGSPLGRELLKVSYELLL